MSEFDEQSLSGMVPGAIRVGSTRLIDNAPLEGDKT